MTVNDLITYLSSLPPDVRELPVYLADWNEGYAPPIPLAAGGMAPWTGRVGEENDQPIVHVFLLDDVAERG